MSTEQKEEETSIDNQVDETGNESIPTEQQESQPQFFTSFFNGLTEIEQMFKKTFAASPIGAIDFPEIVTDPSILNSTVTQDSENFARLICALQHNKTESDAICASETERTLARLDEFNSLIETMKPENDKTEENLSKLAEESKKLIEVFAMIDETTELLNSYDNTLTLLEQQMDSLLEPPAPVKMFLSFKDRIGKQFRKNPAEGGEENQQNEQKQFEEIEIPSMSDTFDKLRARIPTIHQ